MKGLVFKTLPPPKHKHTHFSVPPEVQMVVIREQRDQPFDPTVSSQTLKKLPLKGSTVAGTPARCVCASLSAPECVGPFLSLMFVFLFLLFSLSPPVNCRPETKALFPRGHFKLFSRSDLLNMYEVPTLKQPECGLSQTSCRRWFQKCKSRFSRTWK